MIPKVVHQTWKSREVPQEWRLAQQSWIEHHPDWTYRLWTDDENRRLVADHYPELLTWYDALPYAILRADVARVLIVHHTGGVYADLDVECFRPLDSLLIDQEIVLGREPDGQAIRLRRPSVVSNAIFAATPGHPFLELVIEAFRGSPEGIVTHTDVLESTGPLLFSRVFDADAETANSVVVGAHVFFPLMNFDPRLLVLQSRSVGFEGVRDACVEMGAYTVHYWNNSWMSTLAGDLHNPFPNDVPGFRFFPGSDSNGHDISNGGRDIPRLALECLLNEEALGFNTDGFVKNRIRPMREWGPLSVPTSATGLYVKEGVDIDERFGFGWGWLTFVRRVRAALRGLLTPRG